MLKNSWYSIFHHLDEAGLQGDKMDGIYMEKQSCEWNKSSDPAWT